MQVGVTNALLILITVLFYSRAGSTLICLDF